MFHVDLPIDTQSHRNYHLITVRLLFTHKTIGCVHQTRPRKGRSHSAVCFGVRPLGCHVRNELHVNR